MVQGIQQCKEGFTERYASGQNRKYGGHAAEQDRLGGYGQEDV
jgi:hypothetical protein